MPLHASKLDLLSKTTPLSSSSSSSSSTLTSSSIISLLFEPSSGSLAVSLSDSSYLLFPSFSPSTPSKSPTAVHPPSTTASFLRLLPANRVLFITAAPLDAGASLALRAWILQTTTPPRFDPIRLTYKKSAPAKLPLAHGFGVRLVGTVNYFVVHAPAAGQIWVMSARVEKGEGKETVSVDMVKCAVVDCDLPIYSIGMSMEVIVLGEIGGVRVFPLRTLVKGNELKGKRNGRPAAGKFGHGLLELEKGRIPNGMVIPVSYHSGEVKRVGEEKSSGIALDKLRCARLRQSSGDLYSYFMEIMCKNAISESNTGPLASVKAISIHVLPQKQFLILDSVGELHLLTLHGAFTASEISSDASRSSKD